MGMKEYRAKIFSELYDKLYTLFKFENKFLQSMVCQQNGWTSNFL